MSEIPSGWPCAGLPTIPPSVVDLEAQPTADTLLPQILPLTPRGPAWGTDEAGDGQGASPVQRTFWRALAAWAADHLGLDWSAATQTFPSAITFTLADWERELGLPDPCLTGERGTEARLAAVRSKFASVGGQSGAYMVCLAASLGYAVTIEEPGQFLIDDSELGPDPDGSADAGLDAATDAALVAVSDETVWKYWIVHVSALGDTWFYIDEGEVTVDSIVNGVLQPEGAGDRLEGFLTAADLECVLRRACPEHTVLVFAYDLAA